MSYLDEIEREMRQLLAKEPKFVPVKVDVPEDSEEYQQAVEELADERYTEWEGKILKFLRTKTLESFKNGAAAERKRTQNKDKKSQAPK